MPRIMLAKISIHGFLQGFFKILVGLYKCTTSIDALLSYI